MIIYFLETFSFYSFIIKPKHNLLRRKGFLYFGILYDVFSLLKTKRKWLGKKTKGKVLEIVYIVKKKRNIIHNSRRDKNIESVKNYYQKRKIFFLYQPKVTEGYVKLRSRRFSLKYYFLNCFF